ncbi:MAG TPA: carbonic anhydrase [Acetobacteraceae bacterium]|nr:carbonic anhydrase [Acetobacteraceae bacterium]
MDRLLEGYRRFRRGAWPDRRRLFEMLADHGQQPRAMVITCADSRVDPSMIFDTSPGELFVLRNVASLVPPYAPDTAQHGTSAALEFGVRVLGVSDLMVMGHALCGGVRALLEGPPPEASDFIVQWIAMAESAKQRALAYADRSQWQLRCEQETVKLTLETLLTFPWIAERVADGRLRLQGSHFDIRSGELSLLGAAGAFTVVA